MPCFCWLRCWGSTGGDCRSAPRVKAAAASSKRCSPLSKPAAHNDDTPSTFSPQPSRHTTTQPPSHTPQRGVNGYNGVDAFNLRGFVARYLQVDCGKRRFSFPLGFLGVETGKKCRTMWGVGDDLPVLRGFSERGWAGTRSVFPGVFWKRCVRRSHVLKNRNVGNSSAIFSRGGENAFWNGARRSHRSRPRAGAGVAREGRKPRNEEGSWGCGSAAGGKRKSAS
jgi:hypothetical protein